MYISQFLVFGYIFQLLCSPQIRRTVCDRVREIASEWEDDDVGRTIQ